MHLTEFDPNSEVVTQALVTELDMLTVESWKELSLDGSQGRFDMRPKRSCPFGVAMNR